MPELEPGQSLSYSRLGGEGAWAHPEFGKLIGKVVCLLEFYSAGENLCKKI